MIYHIPFLFHFFHLLYISLLFFYNLQYLYDDPIKGKEYINNQLVYEGEYFFHRKYNGKGYDEEGNIIYELIDGSGKVKEFNLLYCTLKFEGEYLNGQRNWKGKVYDKDGELEYEGEYLNGKKMEMERNINLEK